MAAAGSKLQDELLSEVEISLIPHKLTDSVRVDLGHIGEEFMAFLVAQGHIDEGVHNDIHFMPMSKVPKFCQSIRDAFRVYKMREEA